MKIGVNLHPTIKGQQFSSAQKTYLAQFLGRLNASANLVMDSWESALAYKQMMPKNIVVFRKYHPREGDLYNLLTPEQWHEGMRAYTDPNIVLNCMNEPSTYVLKADMEKKIKWLVRVIELFGNEGNSLVVDNVGTGHYDYTWLTESDKWAIVEPLFAALKKYPNMFWGCHEYFSYRGLEIGNGRVGRHAEMYKHLKAKGYEPPLLLTEVGCDQIDESGKRGFKNSMTENQYAANLTDAQRSTWYVPYLKGAMIYSYGSSTTEWETFDMSDSLVLHAVLIAANAVTETPPSVPIPTPTPTPPPPDPVIVQPPQTPTSELALRRIAALWAERQQLEARKAAIDAEIDQLSEIWNAAA